MKSSNEELPNIHHIADDEWVVGLRLPNGDFLVEVSHTLKTCKSAMFYAELYFGYVKFVDGKLDCTCSSLEKDGVDDVIHT